MPKAEHKIGGGGGGATADVMSEVFNAVGNFGLFQALSCVVPLYSSALLSVHILGPIFTLFTPGHRCHHPMESSVAVNDSSTLSNSKFLSPVADSNLSSSSSSSRQFDISCHYNHNGSITDCHNWLFDTEQFETTLVTEYQLVCSRAKLTTLLTTCTFAGLLVGVGVSGCMSDWFGRRRTLLCSLWLLTIANLAATFALSPTYTAVVAFFVGAGSLATSTVGYVLMLEIVGQPVRHHVTSGFGYSCCVGSIITPLVAMATGSWRKFTMATLAPTAVILALGHLTLFIPETPRWLMSRGRSEEAAVVIGRMLRMNGADKERRRQLLQLVKLKEPKLKVSEREGERSMLNSLMLMAGTPALLLRVCIICLNWFIVSAVYYGISMGSKNLPGNIFVTTSLLGLMELPSAALFHATAERIGRKWMYFLSLTASGVSLLLLTAASVLVKDLTWLIIALSLIGKMLNSTAFSFIYIWTGELYPTCLRSAGLSTSSLFARIGSMLAPVLGNLDAFVGKRWGLTLAYTIFAALSFVGSVAALAVPETRGRRLADTVDDMLMNGSLNVPSVEDAGEKTETPLLEEKN